MSRSCMLQSKGTCWSSATQHWSNSTWRNFSRRGINYMIWRRLFRRSRKTSWLLITFIRKTVSYTRCANTRTRASFILNFWLCHLLYRRKVSFWMVIGPPTSLTQQNIWGTWQRSSVKVSHFHITISLNCGRYAISIICKKYWGFNSRQITRKWHSTCYPWISKTMNSRFSPTNPPKSIQNTSTR